MVNEVDTDRCTFIWVFKVDIPVVEPVALPDPKVSVIVPRVVYSDQVVSSDVVNGLPIADR